MLASDETDRPKQCKEGKNSLHCGKTLLTYPAMRQAILKLKRYIACLLVLVIALQSFAAVADIHQLSQPAGQQHIEFNHDHSLPSPPEAQQADETPLAIDLTDCHHCCHCHSTAQFFPSSTALHIGTVHTSQHPSEYTFINLSRYSPPDLRPPIA